MTTIKVPRKAVVLIIGSPCSGKSFLAKAISTKASQDVASFSYGEGLKEFLTQTGSMFDYAIPCGEHLSMTNTCNIPDAELAHFYMAADKQIISMAKDYDFVVIDSDFNTVHKVQRMVATLNSVRDDKYLVLIKLAPDLPVWEQLKKARYREFGKNAPNAPLEPGNMMAMPRKVDYEDSMPVLHFNYGTPPPRPLCGISGGESVYASTQFCLNYA